LTLLKNNNLRILIFICIAIFIILVFLIVSDNSCGVKHILIVNDLKSYEQSLDPEFCEDLVEKIDLFNSQCEPEVDILDCG